MRRGVDIPLTGSAKDFKLEYYLYILILNKETNLVVDSMIIPAVFFTDSGYRFRARPKAVASGTPGAVIPHDLVILAMDKYRGDVKSATRRRIQVKTPV